MACTNFGGWTNPPILVYFGGTNFGGRPLIRVKFGGNLFWRLVEFYEIRTGKYLRFGVLSTAGKRRLTLQELP